MSYKQLLDEIITKYAPEHLDKVQTLFPSIINQQIKAFITDMVCDAEHLVADLKAGKVDLDLIIALAQATLSCRFPDIDPLEILDRMEAIDKDELKQYVLRFFQIFKSGAKK